ncbi:hypothetical protein V501_00657 [Pseudogymnoascus sp. VKM F-4519 (FW-2642)]|nr:hypothetical protein V501_00657 [Pseudogymnoascus sp. VKM F-4519 (FW-2642)]
MSCSKSSVEMAENGIGDRGSDDAVAPISAAEEAAVIRKLDFRLLPLLFILYSFSVLDRSNLGNAKLAGLETDINLRGNNYEWLGTAFYISYILFQWTTIGWKQFKPHKWVTFVVFYWGFVATIQACVTNWGGLMACRVFLGMSEAMYGPGVPLYLSYFYPRDRIGFRHGIFLSGSALANAYGGVLGYGLSHIRGSVAPWKILFIIEGLPTVILAGAAWFYIPDSINTARFLTKREKDVANSFVSRGQQVETGPNEGIRLEHLLEAFTDPISYIPSLMYFSCNVCFASLPLFVPTIIAEMGSFTRVQSNGLSAPPYLLTFFTIILVAFLSDKFRMRGPFCAGAACVAAVGFILLATTKSTPPRYFGVFLAVNIFVSVAMLLTWTSNLHASQSKRAGGYVILATVGQCGPLLGTNIFPKSEGPYYRKGMWISCAFCLLVALLATSLSLILIRKNRKMDKEEAAAIDAGGDVEVLENRFRYIF